MNVEHLVGVCQSGLKFRNTQHNIYQIDLMGKAQITSYFWQVNDPHDSNEEDPAWDPYVPHQDNVPPYIANEDADLDDPKDNDLEQEDIHINRRLESLSVAVDADEWLPVGNKWKSESQGGVPHQNSFFFFILPFSYGNLNFVLP